MRNEELPPLLPLIPDALGGWAAFLIPDSSFLIHTSFSPKTSAEKVEMMVSGCLQHPGSRPALRQV